MPVYLLPGDGTLFEARPSPGIIGLTPPRRLQLGELDRAAWLGEGLSARFESVSGSDLAVGKVVGAVLDAFGTQLGVKVYAAIRDNGRTEVEPGSLTAVGVRWWQPALSHKGADRMQALDELARFSNEIGLID